MEERAMEEVNQEMLDSPVSDEEIWWAVNRLQFGKAGGLDGILPEMVKCGGGGMLQAL